MNSEQAKEYLNANLAVPPHQHFWNLREHYQGEAYNLSLCNRSTGATVKGLSVKIAYSGEPSEETLKLIATASEELLKEYYETIEAPFTDEDIVGVYASKITKKTSVAAEEPKELSWWKRAINWLWYA